MLVIFALVWLIQNAIVETKHAAAGTTSPRWRAKLARMESGARAPRYGSRDFLADFWGDLLRARTEARRVAARAPEGRADGGFRRRARRTWDAFEDVTDPQPARRAPEPGPGLHPRVRRRTGLDPEEGRDSRVTFHPCVGCGSRTKIIDYDPLDGDVYCDECLMIRYPPSGPIPNPDEADARIIPMFNREKREAPEMSTTTEAGAEAGTFLTTAIQHCEEMAKVHAAHGEAGGEDFIVSLTDAGVRGPKLAAVTEAQQATAEAGELWARAARALSGSTVVKEAYEQEEGTGSREHVTGGE